MLLLLLFIMHRIAGAASRAHIYLSSASIERNSMGKKRFDLILDARDISFFFPSTKPQILSSCNIRFRYSFCSNFYFRIFFIYYIQLFDSKPYFFDCIVSIHWYGWHCDLSTDLLQLRWRIGFFFSVRRWQMEASQDIEYIFFVWNNISVSEMFTPGMHSNEMRELLGNKRKCFKYI